LIHFRRPLIVLLDQESLLEALNSRAKVAYFDENLSLFNVNLWNGLVIKNDFVEADQRQFPVFFFKSFFCFPQVGEYFIFFDSAEVIFL